MDFARPFTYTFEDEEWLKKFGIAFAIAFLLVPILGIGFIALYGYQVAIMRAKIRGERPELPEWDDFGTLLKDGLFYILISIIYSLPLIILGFVMAILGGGVGFLSEGNDMGAIVAILGLLLACIGLFVLVIAIVVALLVPAAIARYADTGEFGAAMKFGEVFALVRQNPFGWILVSFVFNGLVTPILLSLGSILCGIGAFAGQVLGLFAAADAHAQAYVKATGNAPALPADDFGSTLPPTPAPSADPYSAPAPESYEAPAPEPYTPPAPEPYTPPAPEPYTPPASDDDDDEPPMDATIVDAPPPSA